MTPPIAIPWPPIHLVAEFITRSAPSSIGRLRNGVAKVLSISSGIFASWAIWATSGISSTSSPGLPMVSPITSRVFGLIAARNSSSARGLTGVVGILEHVGRGLINRNRAGAGRGIRALAGVQAQGFESRRLGCGHAGLVKSVGLGWIFRSSDVHGSADAAGIAEHAQITLDLG